MKSIKTIAVALSATLVLAGCNMSNTAKGTMIGAGGGAALGAIIGKIAGNTAVGAAIGGAVGAGTGAIIGKKMDKAKKEAQAVQNAQVETITDANGLTAVKVTFDSGILFAVNKADLNAASKSSLQQFAQVLKNNNECDIAIFGHTDSTGSDAVNNPLSKNRAQSVSKYLKSLGVSASQIKTVDGQGSTNPVADNSTEEGRKQNRRVEVYMYASEQMINEANAEASK
ncbi:OmpA family protein [Prevotella sp. P6B1]|uniref:OmpA family protein n=1 Tax=Prevotella sp. P6B1 TaxID=1410613 RepID=UPI00051AB0FC|nr:OmpA family protein [Prevotella sp. P6B1]